jgi:hypothetical protein
VVRRLSAPPRKSETPQQSDASSANAIAMGAGR